MEFLYFCNSQMRFVDRHKGHIFILGGGTAIFIVRYTVLDGMVRTSFSPLLYYSAFSCSSLAAVKAFRADR